jgi:methionyl-tRNA formyltransferase
MRIAICSSKNWFKLNRSTSNADYVKFFTNEVDLSVEALDGFKPDYVFFTHWNWIVKNEIHEKFNCIVFHTAPLPYGRGGSPIQNLILEGFKETPVCAIKMTGELDGGPIYAATNVSLAGTLKAIFSRINDAVNDLIVEIIENDPLATSQLGKPHVFKRLTIKDNEIPTGLKLEEIYDRIRMVDHEDYPNAFIVYDNIRIEFSNAQLVEDAIEVACVIKKLP